MPEPQSRTVAAGDLNIHYLEVGSGPPLLLLHGSTGTAAISWDAAFITQARLLLTTRRTTREEAPDATRG